MNIKVDSVKVRDLLWDFKYKWMLAKRSNDGLVKHSLYFIWIRMLDRCYNPNSSNFRLYGARGIEVCDRWMSLKNFIEDMGDSGGLTLDRIDPDGGYSKDNCRWTTQRIQANNMRKGERKKISKTHEWIMKSKRIGDRYTISELPACYNGGV